MIEAPLASARANDPITSVIAAEQIEASETAATHRNKIAGYVLSNPGQTGAEIAEAINLTQGQVMRRVCEIIKSGRVKYGERRHCTVKGSLMGTIWPQERSR